MAANHCVNVDQDMGGEKSKILIIGGTVYLGQYMVKESVSLGHPTYAYLRPINPSNDSSKLQLHKEFQDMGLTLFERFIPSEFGNEVDRVSGLPPYEAVCENKRRIRRAIEASEISYTCVSGNSFAAYFVDYMLHPHEKSEEVILDGSGEAKSVLNYEKDVAYYTIRAATDQRLVNQIVIIRPQGNIISQLDLISAWEKRTGRSLKRIHV